MKTTQRSSRQTNVPGISPLMMRVKIVAMHPEPYAVDHAGPRDDPDRRGSSATVDVRRDLVAAESFTLARLLCLPLFLYLLFGRDNQAAAAWMLGALGATDWVDGYLARRLGQASEFGKMFDPTVDRLLFIVAIVAIIVDGSIPSGSAWRCSPERCSSA